MLDVRKVLLYVTPMLAKHTSPTLSRQAPELASSRRARPGARSWRERRGGSAMKDETVLDAILATLAFVGAIASVWGVMLMTVPK